MLSYRHAFHAGNHADVLKHSVLVSILEHLIQKEKPFSLIDAHAGAGVYNLQDEWAVKTGEAQDGIVKLLNSIDNIDSLELPLSFKKYLFLCKQYSETNKYPGSPTILYEYLRPKDILQLIELHSTEIENLKSNMHFLALQDKRQDISYPVIHQQNSYVALKGIIPPTPRRGLLLLDPSYEVDSDYINIEKTVKECIKHWSAGIVCVWYPLLSHRESDINILKSSIKDACEMSSHECFCCELLIDSSEKEAGLYGSGMIIVNPTYHLQEEMDQVIPYLQNIFFEG